MKWPRRRIQAAGPRWGGESQSVREVVRKRRANRTRSGGFAGFAERPAAHPEGWTAGIQRAPSPIKGSTVGSYGNVRGGAKARPHLSTTRCHGRTGRGAIPRPVCGTWRRGTARPDRRPSWRPGPSVANRLDRQPASFPDPPAPGGLDGRPSGGPAPQRAGSSAIERSCLRACHRDRPATRAIPMPKRVIPPSMASVGSSKTSGFIGTSQERWADVFGPWLRPGLSGATDEDAAAGDPSREMRPARRRGRASMPATGGAGPAADR
jgi:hypothetical protein